MKAYRLFFVSLFFLLLLNEPVLSIANRPITVAGIPLLYVYVMSVWGLMILVIARVIHRSQTHDDNPADHE